jgi:plastocyanin
MKERMGAPQGSGRRGRLIPLALLLTSTAALHFVTGSSATGPTIEAAEGGGGYLWRPSSATVGPGGTVTFKSASGVVPHGVTWTGGPERPSCSGVPIDQEKTAWSGECAFAQPGTYDFVCYVHPVEMKGTITVSSAESPSSPAPSPGGATESPLRGRASRALRLARSQRGTSVRGSVDLSPVSAGGRLEVLLLARRASLSAAGHSARKRVGRLVRSPLRAGRVSFSVSLRGPARRALRREGKLRLKVKVIVMPPGRAALTLTRGVSLHA